MIVFIKFRVRKMMTVDKGSRLRDIWHLAVSYSRWTSEIISLIGRNGIEDRALRPLFIHFCRQKHFNYICSKTIKIKSGANCKKKLHSIDTHHGSVRADAVNILPMIAESYYPVFKFTKIRSNVFLMKYRRSVNQEE